MAIDQINSQIKKINDRISYLTKLTLEESKLIITNRSFNPQIYKHPTNNLNIFDNESKGLSSSKSTSKAFGNLITTLASNNLNNNLNLIDKKELDPRGSDPNVRYASNNHTKFKSIDLADMNN